MFGTGLAISNVSYIVGYCEQEVPIVITSVGKETANDTFV